MAKCRRYTTYILLLVFGLLSVKNFLPMSEGLRGNCQELGHIHIYSTEKFHDDDECHEGKQIISSYSPASEVTFDLQVPNYNLVYDFVWTVENFFSSPYLEVQRKPPKIA